MGLMQKAEQVSGYGETVARTAVVLGGGSEMLGKSFSDYLADARSRFPITIGDGLGTVAGAAAGGYLGYHRKHPILGVILGASAGRNGPALLHAATRKDALWSLSGTGAAVMAAASSKTKLRSALTFMGVKIVVGLIHHWGE